MDQRLTSVMFYLAFLRLLAITANVAMAIDMP
jgi:hypothetical protein